MTYGEKLKSPKWQKKRLQILERDNWTRQYCGDTERNLQIHHLSYSNGNPWDVEDKQLVTVCETCHNALTFTTSKEDNVFKINHDYRDGFIMSEVYLFRDGLFGVVLIRKNDDDDKFFKIGFVSYNALGRFYSILSEVVSSNRMLELIG